VQTCALPILMRPPAPVAPLPLPAPPRASRSPFRLMPVVLLIAIAPAAPPAALLPAAAEPPVSMTALSARTTEPLAALRLTLPPARPAPLVAAPPRVVMLALMAMLPLPALAMKSPTLVTDRYQW